MPQLPSQRLTIRSLTTKPSPAMMSRNHTRSSTLTTCGIGPEAQVTTPSAFTTIAPSY